MSDKPHKHEKWEKFKGAMKKAGKWTVKNLLPVAISMAAGGLGLPVALGGLASELFKKFSNANIRIPISEEKFKGKLEEFCKGEGKVIEYLQEKLEEENSQMLPEDIKLVIEHVMTPVVSEMDTMLEIIKEEKTDLRDILAGWLDEQSQLLQKQSQFVQDEFLLTHEQLSSIKNEMLDRFQKLEIQQIHILENINEFQSKMQFELSNLKRQLSELLQSVFGQVQTAYDLDSMFNLATVHFNHQNLASRFDLPYNPDLYVRPESFFGSMTKYLSDFKDPMKKNVPIFLLLAHLGMGKTWNFAYITEYILIKRNIAIPFFINLKDGLQQQLYSIFKTQNMREIADRCQKIMAECQLPIFLILDGLDELTSSDLKDVLLILKELLYKRSDALCVALSCRIIAWVQDQLILNERRFFEDNVWSDHNCNDWKTQFNIATPISCVLGEFSDIELDAAIECYGLNKDYFSNGLYEICHQPYILRLVGEFVSLHNFYPEPEDPQTMASLFYSDDRSSQKNTIMYRMAIHGNVLSLFSRIIKAFPSADSELSPDAFQKFMDNQYIRPILYSGIILKVRRQMMSYYKINPVYAPLLAQLFPHLTEPEKASEEQPDSLDMKASTSADQVEQPTNINSYQYFINLADQRKAEGNFAAELEALQDAERIVLKAFDVELTLQFEKRMAEFEKENKVRQEAARIAREEEERKAREEEERRAREEAERKAREEEERKAKENADKNKLVDFKGTKIPRGEMEAITEIENEVGDIPVVSDVDTEDFGIAIEGNHVVGLVLRGKGFTSAPESIGQLTKLENLGLRANQLTTLPDSFGQLKELKELNLQDNLFSTLPNVICQLTSLKILYLQENRLTSLPTSIGQLSSLTHLNLNENRLTSLPESTGQLSSLIYLSLNKNQLTLLPYSIGQMSSLKYMSLEENKLKPLPDSLKNLPSLVKVWLDIKMENDNVVEYWKRKKIEIEFKD